MTALHILHNIQNKLDSVHVKFTVNIWVGLSK